MWVPGDLGKRRVGVDEHFLILLSLMFENSERDTRTVKEHLIQQHIFLKHGIVDFMLCSVQGLFLMICQQFFLSFP